MNKQKFAIVAAAGLGTRMNNSVPKVLSSIGNTSCIQKLLSDLNNCVDHIFLVLGYEKEKIRKICQPLLYKTTIVNNDHYLTNNTLDSFKLGITALQTKFSFVRSDTIITLLTGDLIIKFQDLFKFTTSLSASAVCGLSPLLTKDGYKAIYDKDFVYDLNINIMSELEWANIANLRIEQVIFSDNKYLREVIQEILPLKYEKVTAIDIDYQQDLEKARLIHKLNKI
jgi:GTP:adenosylcobinamide-phosphate guanylyltransferase